MTKREMLLKNITEGLKLDISLVENGDRSYDVLGTLRVNRDVAKKRFPTELAELIARADELLKGK